MGDPRELVTPSPEAIQTAVVLGLLEEFVVLYGDTDMSDDDDYGCPCARCYEADRAYNRPGSRKRRRRVA